MAAPARKAKNLKASARAGVTAARVAPRVSKLAESQAAHKEALEQQRAIGDILAVISRSPSDLQPIFDTILASALRLCGAHLGVLNVWNGATYRTVAQQGAKGKFAKWLFERGDWTPSSFSIPMRMVREKRSIQVDDLRTAESYRKGAVSARKFVDDGGTRTYLMVPLLKEGAVIGAIGIYRPEVRPFTQKQIALVQTFASQAVIAMENARLLNETKQALERQTATAEILKVISSSPTNTQPVFEVIAKNAVRVFGGFSASVTRLVGDELQLVAFTTTGRSGDEALKGLFPVPLSDAKRPHAIAIRTKAPVYINDTEAPGLVPQLRGASRARGFRSFIVVPLLREGEAIGTLGVTRREPGPFSARQIELLETFAAQAVIAIENARLFNETKEALERQTATAEILKVISASPTDTQPVFDVIARNAARVLGGFSAAVTRRVGDALHLVGFTSTGSSGDAALKSIFPVALSDSDRPHGIAARTKAPVIVEDTENPALPEGVRTAGRARGFRSILVVPMIRDGEAIGTIAVSRRQAGKFSDYQIDLLKTFADQAVIAIENARLFNETKEALEQQTATGEILGVISQSTTDVRPVFETIAENARTLLGGSSCGVILIQGAEARMGAISTVHGAEDYERALKAYPMALSELPRLRPQFARVLDTRHPTSMTDVEAESADAPLLGFARSAGIRSNAVVPMLREGEPIGLIVVNRREPHVTTPEEIRLLESFASQAVIAIENVRLFNETKEALERQTATSEILKVISSSPTDVQPVFEAIVQSGLKLFPEAGVTVVLRDGDQVRMAAVSGRNADRLRTRFPFPLTREYMHGLAILDRTLVDIPDAQAYTNGPLLPGIRNFLQSGSRAQTVLPMIRGDEAIGAISVTHEQPGQLTDKQLALFQTFADQAVIAIENVRLFKETKASLEQQTAISEVLRVISSSPTDVQPAFDAVAGSAMRLTDGLCAAIVLFGDQRIELAAISDTRGPEFQARWRSAFPMSLDSETVAALKKSGSGLLGDRVCAEAPDLAHPPAMRLMVRAGDAMPIGALMVFRGDAGDLTPKQRALLTTLSGQAEIAFENVRLFKETRDSLDQQTATGKILRVIAESPTTVQPVFDAIASSAMRLFEFDVFAVAVTVVRSNQVELAAMAADASLQGNWRRFYPLPLDRDSITGRTILDKAAQSVSDLEGTVAPEFGRQLEKAIKVRSVIGAPMVREGAGIGAIMLFRATPGKVTDKQLALLRTFADQAAIAVENVRLFNETKESLDQQTAISEVLRVISGSPTDVEPILQAVASRAMRICDASDARIWLVDGDRLRYTSGVGDVPIQFKVGDSIRLDRSSVTGRSIIDRGPVHIEDLTKVPREEFALSIESQQVTGHRTMLAVPLMREDRALGGIALRRMEMRPFTEKQIVLLRTFADQAAIAIENVRLFNETREALEQQQASGEVLGAISNSIADTKPVFDKIVESCARLFEGHYVGIGIVGADGLLYTGAYHGPQREEFEKAFPVPVTHESATGRAILTGEVAHFPDVDAPDVPPYLRRTSSRIGGKSAIVAPMMWKGRGIGGVFVGRQYAGPFSDKAIRQLKTFADQAVIAIQNARLFREIEEKSAQLEVANKHKSEFLANMSHELRTPLNAVIGFSEVLIDKMFGEVNEKQADYLKDIHESGKHLLSLINDILDLSKIEAGRMELEVSSFHLPTAISNAMTLVRERAMRHGIELGKEIDSRLGEFKADERKFKQIMLNLLSNAVKFTPDGGRVDVCAKLDTTKVEIAVRDTGVGIAPEDQTALFEEFKQVGRDHTRKAEGTGLGLALTKRFVELHGGEIRVASAPGKGSTFTVLLPLRE